MCSAAIDHGTWKHSSCALSTAISASFRIARLPFIDKLPCQSLLCQLNLLWLLCALATDRGEPVLAMSWPGPALTAICDASIEDIEDAPPVAVEQRPARPVAQPLTSLADQVAVDVDEETRRRVPGAQSIYVKTFGCSHNQSDSEYMMGILQAYGYRYGIETCRPKAPLASS